MSQASSTEPLPSSATRLAVPDDVATTVRPMPTQATTAAMTTAFTPIRSLVATTFPRLPHGPHPRPRSAQIMSPPDQRRDPWRRLPSGRDDPALIYCLVVPITPEGGRVLGCLVEKQLTTPQQYPLTANALSSACNQTTNREPVVALDEDTVRRALDGLKEQRLVRFVLPSHGRSVVRYRHVLDEVYGLDADGLALLALLLFRGPQTPGELRARAGRMAEFGAVELVQLELESLAARPEALVRLLPRRPGQKEDRWQQLLAGPWSDGSDPVAGGPAPAEVRAEGAEVPGPDAHEDGPPLEGISAGVVSPEGSAGATLTRRDEIDELRAEVAALRASVAELAGSLDSLRRSLGG